jgi:hypothetical protein
MLDPHSPVPVGNITITSISLVNANDQPVAGVWAGEQFYVQANFTTQGLPSYASYEISYTVNGLTKETGSLTWGAGSSGAGSWFAYWGPWTAADGPNVVTVTTSYADNSKDFKFNAPSPVHHGPMLGPPPTSPGPTGAPAISFIHVVGPYPYSPTRTSAWDLQNTSPYTISVEYEVQNYKNKIWYRTDHLQMTLGGYSSHSTVGGTWDTIGGDVYTSQVTVQSAAYASV